MGPELIEDEENPTGNVCADCESGIALTEEAFLVQVVTPAKAGGAVLFFPVIDEHDVAGDFLFEPYLYCFTCWEEHWDNLKNEANDSPPVADGYSVIECACCGSGIREWEYAGTFTLGELRTSPREPNNTPGAHFVPVNKPEVICLYCLRTFNENYIEMWNELSQFGECADCTHFRCWRYQNPGCSCACHQETTQETHEHEQG